MPAVARRWLDAGATAVVGAAFAATLPRTHPDLFWHIAAGEWMLDRGAILERDVFSFTRAGAPYDTGQWLSDVLIAAVWRAAGGTGIDALILVGAAAVAAFAASAGMRAGASQPWAAVIAVGVTIAATGVIGDVTQLWSVALFAILVDILLAARAGAVRRLALVPGLFLMWANLHPGFLIGLFALAIFALDALVRRSHVRALAPALVASALAALVSPIALQTRWSGVSATVSSSLRVADFAPTDVLTPSGLAFAALLIAAVFLALSVLDESGPRERFLWPALVVPLVVVALAAQRQIPFASIAMAPFVASAATLLFARARLGALAPVGAALVLVALGTLAAQRAHAEAQVYPAAAVLVLSGASGNLLNELEWGGYLMHAQSGKRVFVDSRGPALYPDALFAEFDRLVSVRPGFRDLLRQRDIALALLRDERPLAVVLREEGWEAVAQEPGRWVLLARP